MIRILIEKVKEVRGKTKEIYPEKINSAGKQALYNNLGKNEELAISVHEAIVAYARHGWRDNTVPAKMKQVRKAVRNALPDKTEEELSEIMNIIIAQKEY